MNTFAKILGKAIAVTAILFSITCNKVWADGASQPVYVGAALGSSSFQTNFYDFEGQEENLRAQSLGWKVLMGARPLSFLGGEIEYLDFGQHSIESNDGNLQGSLRARAAAAFIVGYLPLPDPRFDVFAKVGGARYRTSYNYTESLSNTCVFDPVSNTCVPVTRYSSAASDDETGFAYGLGAQFHIGHFAIRGEFEGITGARTLFYGQSLSANRPSLLSIGFIWSL